MGEVKTIKIQENITAPNDRRAQETRSMLSRKGVFFLNVMSSPGSGKTTLLTALINRMKEKVRIAEMDVDITSTLDAQRVADATGVRAMQIHNGGLCHIDADMTARALQDFSTDDIDFLILENIGNLVCPAEFDTGAHKNMMLLSVPEGDDKPLKYPLMFSVSDIILITKTDTAPYFNFDTEAAKERILQLNPSAKILCVSARTGEGLDELEELLMKEIAAVKKQADS